MSGRRSLLLAKEGLDQIVEMDVRFYLWLHVKAAVVQLLSVNF